MSLNHERAAESWHEEYNHAATGVWNGSCWCCCDACNPDHGGDNPFYELAMQQMAARREVKP